MKIVVALFALPILLLSMASGVSQAQPPGQSAELHASFTFSGSFAPTSIDSDKDGHVAEIVTADVDGRLEGTGTGKQLSVKLVGYTNMIEYGLLDPATDACTSCFRVNEKDYTVEENVYVGPMAGLIRPLRDPVANPSSSAYSAEEWTAFFRLATGELIYLQVTDTKICVEKAEPVPICHVKTSEKIVGGTGRFKHATGHVEFAAIAPTYTSDAPLISENGCIDPSRPTPTFSFGPVHGAGRMTVEVPLGGEK